LGWSETIVALPILRNVFFDFPCPACGQARRGNGLWFRSIRRFVCEGCGATVTITYEEKKKLLGTHEEKAELPAEASPSIGAGRPVP
jgi:transposase-like protein